MARPKNVSDDGLELQTAEISENPSVLNRLNLFESFKSKFDFKEDTYFVHQIIDGNTRLVPLKGSFDDLKNYKDSFHAETLVYWSELITTTQNKTNNNDYFKEVSKTRKFVLSTSLLFCNIFSDLRASTRVVGFDNQTLFAFQDVLQAFAFFYETTSADFAEHFIKKTGQTHLQANYEAESEIARRRVVVTGTTEFHLFNVVNFPTDSELDTKAIYSKLIDKLNLVK